MQKIILSIFTALLLTATTTFASTPATLPVTIFNNTNSQIQAQLCIYPGNCMKLASTSISIQNNASSSFNFSNVKTNKKYIVNVQIGSRGYQCATKSASNLKFIDINSSTKKIKVTVNIATKPYKYAWCEVDLN